MRQWSPGFSEFLNILSLFCHIINSFKEKDSNEVCAPIHPGFPFFCRFWPLYHFLQGRRGVCVCLPAFSGRPATSQCSQQTGMSQSVLWPAKSASLIHMVRHMVTYMENTCAEVKPNVSVWRQSKNDLCVLLLDKFHSTGFRKCVLSFPKRLTWFENLL